LVLSSLVLLSSKIFKISNVVLNKLVFTKASVFLFVALLKACIILKAAVSQLAFCSTKSAGMQFNLRHFYTNLFHNHQPFVSNSYFYLKAILNMVLTYLVQDTNCAERFKKQFKFPSKHNIANVLWTTDKQY
jgi:hypothetical protein